MKDLNNLDFCDSSSTSLDLDFKSSYMPLICIFLCFSQKKKKKVGQHWIHNDEIK